MGDKSDDVEEGFRDGRDGGGALGRFLGRSEHYYKGYHEGEKVYSEHGHSQEYRDTPDLMDYVKGTFSSDSPGAKEKGRSSGGGALSSGGYSGYGGSSSSRVKGGDGFLLTLGKIAVFFVGSQLLAFFLIYISIPLRVMVFEMENPGLGEILLGIAVGLIGIVLYFFGFMMALPSAFLEMFLKIDLTPSFYL